MIPYDNLLVDIVPDMMIFVCSVSGARMTKM